MFKAEAVWKTDKPNGFNPAGFTIEVDIEPVSMNFMPDSMTTMFEYMGEDKCDGFSVDLGNGRKQMFVKE